MYYPTGARLCVIVLLLLVSVSHAAQSFKTLALLDVQGQNILFRGGSPIVNNAFAYDALVAEMSAIRILPYNFELVIYNFMFESIPSEALDIQLELDYWKANPSKGRTVVYSKIQGSSTSPYGLSEGVIREKVSNLTSVNTDNLPYILNEVRNLLIGGSTPGRPLVIFVHCTCGCDRTGEFSAAYSMQYQGKTMAQARDTNVALIGREIMTTNYYGSQWYCFYLKFERYYNLTCEAIVPGSVIPPQCSVRVDQVRNSYWNSGGQFYSQWNVRMSNTNATENVPLVMLYVLSGSTQIENSWGYTVDNRRNTVSSPEYQRGLAGGQTFDWGYITKGVTPANFLVVYPDACVNTVQPYPAPDDTCHLTATQRVIGTWTSNGHDYANVEVTLSNTSPTLPVYNANVTLSCPSGTSTVSQFWNIEKTPVGQDSYSLPATSMGIQQGGTYTFGYIARGAIGPMKLKLTIPSVCA